MKSIPILAIIFFLLIPFKPAYTQETRQSINIEQVPRGISIQDWIKMNERWQPYATLVSIKKNDGSQVEGHLTWMNDSVMLVQKQPGLPNAMMNTGDYAWVPISDMASMKVRLGGHPYQGLIIGLLAGMIPGFVTGAILAQGWTIIPAIIFGAVTAAGGGVAGSFIQKAGRKQTYEIKAEEFAGHAARRMKKSALFPDELPAKEVFPTVATLPDFDKLVDQSPTLQRAFPVNPFTLSVQTTLMTNSVQKRLQNWYMSPLFGPPEKYYQTRIGLQADISRNLGTRFQAGLLFQLFPGDISSTFFNSYPNYVNLGVSYDYNHHFKQTTLALYGGWLLKPTDRYWASRLEATVQVGLVASDIYEHFYFQWTSLTPEASGEYRRGETFIQEHNIQPGLMGRIKTSWYLIPGFSIDTGLEGFWIKSVFFAQRDVLPETNYDPVYIGQHTLNFSNLQGFIGFSIHW